MIRASTFAGRDVAVFGLGASGLATVHALVEGGARVAAWDDNPDSRAVCEAQGISLVDLSVADFSDFAALVLAPGVPLTHPKPHWAAAKARAADIEIIGDIEIFVRERRRIAPQAPFIAITGTNGKSTTTALIAHILKSAGKNVEMGGNIGHAILTLAPPSSGTVHVIEISSFQIDLTPSLDPTVGVLLNITPDHLDRHGTLEAYAAVKEKLVQGAGIAVTSVDDDFCVAILKRRVAHGLAAAFSAQKSIAPGYSMLGSEIVCSDATGKALKLGNLHGISTLRGKHNAQNALAAVAAVRECLNATGQSSDIDWQKALNTFPGLPHRLEEIGRLGPVVFVNDSKATNADSTEKALQAFPNDVFWILGGKPKSGGIESLRPYFPGVVRAYLIGEASAEFSQTLDGDVAIIPCGTLAVAVERASADATAYARGEAMPLYNVEGSSGAGITPPWAKPDPRAVLGAEPIVLLSPACASYDQFKNFEVRGEAFRALTQALPGFAARSI